MLRKMSVWRIAYFHCKTNLQFAWIWGCFMNSLTTMPAVQDPIPTNRARKKLKGSLDRLHPGEHAI